MSIFYNMNTLLRLSSNNVDKLIGLIKDYKTNKTVISGNSFLLKPEKLLDSRESNFSKAEYVYLASFRNYTDYILLGIDYLDISYIPDIDVAKVSRNPLISIEDNKIKFKKEV